MGPKGFTLILAVVILAPGCTERRSPGSDEAAGSEGAATHDSAARSASIWGCRGALALFDVPDDHARSVVPDAFEPDGYTSATGSVLMNALQCEGGAVDSVEWENVEYFEVSVFVRPKDSAWTNPNASTERYAAEVLASPPSFADALEEFGLGSGAADFSRDMAPGVGGPTAGTWEVAGSNSTFEFESWTGGMEWFSVEAQDSLWTGGRPFARIDIGWTYTYDLSDGPGTLRASGSTPGASLVGAASAVKSQSFISFDSTMTIGPQTYG